MLIEMVVHKQQSLKVIMMFAVLDWHYALQSKTWRTLFTELVMKPRQHLEMGACSLRSLWSPQDTSRFKSWQTTTAMWCTCTRGTALCKGVIRRSESNSNPGPFAQCCHNSDPGRLPQQCGAQEGLLCAEAASEGQKLGIKPKHFICNL